MATDNPDVDEAVVASINRAVADEPMVRLYHERYGEIPRTFCLKRSIAGVADAVSFESKDDSDQYLCLVRCMPALYWQKSAFGSTSNT